MHIALIVHSLDRTYGRPYVHTAVRVINMYVTMFIDGDHSSTDSTYLCTSIVYGIQFFIVIIYKSDILLLYYYIMMMINKLNFLALLFVRSSVRFHARDGFHHGPGWTLNEWGV